LQELTASLPVAYSAKALCVCVQNEVGCGLVLAAGFLFDLEIFLKIFLEFFPPTFFNSQIVYLTFIG
jgi:hypothetical protein